MDASSRPCRTAHRKAAAWCWDELAACFTSYNPGNHPNETGQHHSVENNAHREKQKPTHTTLHDPFMVEEKNTQFPTALVGTAPLGLASA